MKSPFPGVDPYLLQHWFDACLGLVVYSRGQMSTRLPKGLVARVNRDEATWAPFIEISQTKPTKHLTTRIEFPPPPIQTRPEPIDSVSLVVVDLFGPEASVLTRRSWQPTNAVVQLLSVREPLPKILIPLRQDDDDFLVELQPVLDQCYRNGSYDDIDYQEDPDPPLEGHDADWADALLRKAGKRK